MPEFDPNENFFLLSSPENGKQITEKGNRVQCISFKGDIENQKVEGLIAYSIDQLIF